MVVFEHVIVDGDNPGDPHCKAAGDRDGDGYPDLLATSASGGGLFWYRYPAWSKYRIAAGTFTTDWNNHASTGGALELWVNQGVQTVG